MKTSTGYKSNAKRLLRLENLEDRQMLSATPLDSVVAVEAASALVATSDFSDEIVNLGELEETSSDLAFTAAERSDSYNVSWNAFDDADVVKYNVKISRDSGETWITYRKLDADTTTLQVNGLYVGRSYSLRVYGAAENGVPLAEFEPLEGTFAPVRLASTSETYKVSKPIEITLDGADNSSADIKWYSVTDDGETEITEAAGLLSYTPAEELGTIKVVATGTGVSSGSSSEITFAQFVNKFDVDYNAPTRQAPTRQATITWDAIDGASTYRIRAYRLLPNGTYGWADVPRAQSLTDTTFTLNGLYAGKSYQYRVYGYGGGEVLGYHESVIAPVVATTDASSYWDGDTIAVTIRASDDASYTIKWYYITADGDVEISEASGLTSYTTDSSSASGVRVMVTGTGSSAGSSSEIVVSREIEPLEDYSFDPYYTLNRNVTVNWNYNADVAKYRFLKLNSNGVWARAADITVSDGAVTSGNATIKDGEVSYTVNMLNAGAEGQFKIVAFDANDAVLDEMDLSYDPIGVELNYDAFDARQNYVYTITATTTPETDVTYQWYSSTNASSSIMLDNNSDAVTWTEIEGATSASLTVDAVTNGVRYKLVATDAADPTRQTVVYADTIVASADEYLPVLTQTVAEDGSIALFFNEYSDATGYQFEYYYSDGDYPVWLNLPRVTYTVENGIVTATQPDADKAHFKIRVRALAQNGVSLWNGLEQNNLIVTTSEDVVDPYDGATSLREAIAYQQELRAIGLNPEAVTFAEHISTVKLESPIDITTYDVVISADPAARVTIDSSYGAEGHGALSVDGCTLEVSGLEFTGGDAGSPEGSAITVTNGGNLNGYACVFTGNASAVDGGVVYSDDHSNLCIVSSFFKDNSGVMINANNSGAIANCTIVIDGDNGCYGLYVGSESADVEVYNTVVAVENADPSAPRGIYLERGTSIWVYGLVATRGQVAAHSYDSDNSNGAIKRRNVATVYTVEESVLATVLDYETGEIQDTLVPACQGNHERDATISLVDSGTTDVPVDLGSSDVEGHTRVNGGSVDIGAWEYGDYTSGALLEDAFVDYFDEGI
jgi:hypothetical protein